MSWRYNGKKTMNWARIYPITIIALFFLVAFPFAYAGQLTIYGEEGGTRVIGTPDSNETQKGEQWHRVYDYPGQQEDENQATLQREQAEIVKKQEDERITTERTLLRRQQEAETEKMEMERNQRGGVAQRPLNPLRFNHGQPLQQQTGRDAVRPSWARPNPAGAANQPRGNVAPVVPRGAINTRTGEYYPPAAGGVTDPRTGTFYKDVGGGFINTRDGSFSPKIGE
jgi:hypothetical protein